MSKQMNGNSRIWIVVAVVIVAAALAALWATSGVWVPRLPFRHRPPSNIPGDLEFYYTAKTVVSTVNIVLLASLLATYVSIYAKTRSQFTIGLIVFASVFLLNALTSNPFIIYLFGFQPVGLGPFALLPDLFTLAALTVLLYLSIKY